MGSSIRDCFDLWEVDTTQKSADFQDVFQAARTLTIAQNFAHHAIEPLGQCWENVDKYARHVRGIPLYFNEGGDSDPGFIDVARTRLGDIYRKTTVEKNSPAIIYVNERTPHITVHYTEKTGTYGVAHTDYGTLCFTFNGRGYPFLDSERTQLHKPDDKTKSEAEDYLHSSRFSRKIKWCKALVQQPTTRMIFSVDTWARRLNQH